MTLAAMAHLPNHSCWTFSSQLYGHETVQQSLTSLRNRHNIDVNILLFCCWFAVTGRGRLKQKEAKKLLLTVQPWQEKITQPLLYLHKQLHPKSNKANYRDIQQEILQIKLAVDQVEQLILTEALLKPQHQLRTPEQKLTDACHNIAIYYKVLRSTLQQEDFQALSEVLKIIFPAVAATEVEQRCKSFFASIWHTTVLNHPQFKLDFAPW